MTVSRRLSRRQFLRLAGTTGALALPALAGYGLWQAAEGEPPPTISPYAAAEAWTSAATPSRPVLVLTSERGDNPFGPYLAEVLRAEGVNSFYVARLPAIDRAALGRFHLVLLAEGLLDSPQAELLEGYVAQGGRLVALRPDARLASLLGVERAAGQTVDGYLQVESEHPVGQGIAAEALQFHGTADHYLLAGAQAVAWLATKAARTRYPAVTVNRYGDGQAALWAFDLARSVALTRQGNPAWANQERDGRDGIRAHDAFVGWIDLDRIAIPQADEQMRLLTQLLGHLLSDVLPLPRLWYVPGAAPAMLIATGDSHQNPTGAIDEVLRKVEQRGGHMTVYYAPPLVRQWRRATRRAQGWATDLPWVGDVFENSASSPTPLHIADWRARGHEFALHPYVEEGLEAGWGRYWQEFTGLDYGPISPTVRTHRILWTGWVETARVQAARGMRMNFDYYHIGPAFRDPGGEWRYGHFTGSGLPMRFVDEQGRILNIYQQLTQLVDEHLIEVPWGGNFPQISVDEAVEVSRALLQRSLQEAPSAIAAQFHLDPFAVGGKVAEGAARWLEGTLDHAAEQGIPIWSAVEWLRFTETRHDAVLEDLRWDAAARQLRFRLDARPDPDVELAVMAPLQHGGLRLDKIEVDGAAVAHRERKVGGVTYGGASVEAGPHQVVASYA